MTNKITLRIPTKDPYAFVELALEDVSASEAKEYYDSWTREFTGDTIGVTQKEFNDFLDCYMNTGSPPENGITLWEEMSTEQKIVINHVKKAFARIKPKQ